MNINPDDVSTYWVSEYFSSAEDFANETAEAHGYAQVRKVRSLSHAKDLENVLYYTATADRNVSRSRVRMLSQQLRGH